MPARRHARRGHGGKRCIRSCGDARAELAPLPDGGGHEQHDQSEIDRLERRRVRTRENRACRRQSRQRFGHRRYAEEEHGRRVADRLDVRRIARRTRACGRRASRSRSSPGSARRAGAAAGFHPWRKIGRAGDAGEHQRPQVEAAGAGARRDLAVADDRDDGGDDRDHRSDRVHESERRQVAAASDPRGFPSFAKMEI